jgi:hypothetical protein
MINMSWEGLSCVKWLNQCPVECLIIREAWTGVTDRLFSDMQVVYLQRPVINMLWEGLSCVKWLNQCPVECLIIREAWTGVTDRLFSYTKVVLSTAPRDKYVVGRLELCEMIKPLPRGMLDNTGSLNWCEWSFIEFNICKWFYLQRPVENMLWDGLSCVKWFNQCPVECLIIWEAWTGVNDRLFSHMKVVLFTRAPWQICRGKAWAVWYDSISAP